MDLLLKGYFEKFLSTHELVRPEGAEIDDAEKMSALYEKFVNYTLFSVDEPDAFTANTELLDFVSPGGEGDAKIDGFGILVQGRLVQDKDDILRILNLVRKINVEFVVIQTKMRPRFNNTEFLAFGMMIRKFFSKNPPTMNEHLRELYDLKNFIFEEPKVYQALQNNPRLTLYYANIGKFIEDENYLSTKETIRSFFDDPDSKGDYLELTDVKVIDANETRKKAETLENNYDVRLNINKSMTLTVGNNDNIKKAVSFTCSGAEFLKLLSREDDSLRRSLFNDNVRDYLGGGSVNKEIEYTMKNEPELFLLCNNGITIVSSDFEPIKDDLVRIVNPQIVNGCQTSNTLYNLRHEIDQNNLLLSVRVICTDNNEITNKVVRSTNRQNQVLEEAFETTKPYHQDIEKTFAFTSEPVKLYYERRSRQYAFDSFIPKSHIVNLRVLTHVFVAALLNRPEEAHRHEAKLLEKYGRENRRIFCNSHSLNIYYLCGLLYYRVEEAINHYPEHKTIDKYRGQLYFIIRVLLAPNVPGLNANNKKCEQFEKQLLKGMKTADEFRRYFLAAVGIFNKARCQWNAKGNSLFAIKDRPDFTTLLIEEIKKHNPDTDIEDSMMKLDLITNTGLTGKIMCFQMNKMDKWYSYIKPDDGSNNVYFDGRYYHGEIRKIVPKTPVKYDAVYDAEGRCHAENIELL